MTFSVSFLKTSIKPFTYWRNNLHLCTWTPQRAIYLVCQATRHQKPMPLECKLGKRLPCVRNLKNYIKKFLKKVWPSSAQRMLDEPPIKDDQV